MLDPRTRPGDLIGRDTTGHIRIDRVIPLPWLAGLAGLLAVNGFAMWFGLKTLTESVAEMKIEMRSLSAKVEAASRVDVEHRMLIDELRRRQDSTDQRVSTLEAAERGLRAR